MTDDLISRSALMEFARNHVGGIIDCNDIARFPAVDAKPVRHGKWRKHGNADIWRCTKCGKYAGYPENFCPNCGAKMDAEVSGDE